MKSLQAIFQTELKPIHQELKSVRQEFQNVRQEFKRDLEIFKLDISEQIGDKVDTETFREYRNEVLTGLDKVMGELKTIRQEFTLHFGQHRYLTERVEKLEKISAQHGKVTC